MRDFTVDNFVGSESTVVVDWLGSALGATSLERRRRDFAVGAVSTVTGRSPASSSRVSSGSTLAACKMARTLDLTRCTLALVALAFRATVASALLRDASYMIRCSSSVMITVDLGTSKLSVTGAVGVSFT